MEGKMQRWDAAIVLAKKEPRTSRIQTGNFVYPERPFEALGGYPCMSLMPLILLNQPRLSLPAMNTLLAAIFARVRIALEQG
jgi:hypothetical protein